MNAIAWITGIVVASYVGYVAGRLVAAITYLPMIEELRRRNKPALDWDAQVQLYERKHRIKQ